MLIAKEFNFEAAHRLPNVPTEHKCYRLHGHSYRFEVGVDGPINESMGWVMDFGDITKAVAPILERLDHRYLNEVPGLQNPTSELLARWLANELSGLKGLRRITVRETCTSSCTIDLFDPLQAISSR